MIRRTLLVLLAALAGVLLPPATAGADPGPARILDVRPLGGRQLEVVVHSAAMDRPITLWVSNAGAGTPVLYLLNAVDGGEDGGPWTRRTDVAEFYADKPITVVVPMGGRASYYTDWQADDPVLGRNRWSTFLGDELPPLLQQRFGTADRMAVAGVSMSATSALNLAIEHPGRFRAVGAFSGCPRTSDPAARAMVYAQLGVFGANATNMWGGPADPAWPAHDPTLNADRLRGTALYVSAGNGLPGRHDSLAEPDRAVVGGIMESVIGPCTGSFLARLAELGIPAATDLRAGTHAWPYWQDDLRNSWPVIAAAVGA
ncbi:alpha/beta hydrolase [Nocardia jiangsuensis]|uniref:Alpha/beta hydrolase n=1 Tax=Nocardia jiangsuensis TaxID=1691563 RepID=A0ABV8DP13_9NOCA